MARGRDSLNATAKRRVIVSVWLAYSEAATGTADAFVCPCLWCGETADRTLAADDAGRGEAGHFVADSVAPTFDVTSLHPTCRVCNRDAGDTNPADLWEPAYVAPTTVRLVSATEADALTAERVARYDAEAARRRGKRTAR